MSIDLRDPCFSNETGETIHRVKSIHSHPLFGSNYSLGNDIALIEVSFLIILVLGYGVRCSEFTAEYFTFLCENGVLYFLVIWENCGLHTGGAGRLFSPIPFLNNIFLLRQFPGVHRTMAPVSISISPNLNFSAYRTHQIQ